MLTIIIMIQLVIIIQIKANSIMEILIAIAMITKMGIPVIMEVET
jgi:hypothetical protein